MKRSFSQLPNFIAESQSAITALLRASTQDVGEVMQRPKAKGGRMPVDTGFLRNSLQSGLRGSTGLTGQASFDLLADTIDPGDVGVMKYSAEYAAAVNNGIDITEKQDSDNAFDGTAPIRVSRAGERFVEGAADAWPAIVAANVRKIKAKLG